MRGRFVPLCELLACMALVTACSEQPVPGPETPAMPTEQTQPAGASTPAESTPTPWFRDATAASGIDFEHDWGATAERHLPETMGAGAAIFDADEDGDLDVYFVQGGAFPPRPDAAAPNRLYLNQGGLKFTDATASSGDAAHTGYGMAVTCGDANGDGHVDLFVTNFGPDVLLLGNGKGAFTDATQGSGILDDRWTAGAMFFDADGDGDQDLYVTAYVQIDVENPQWCGRRDEGWRSYCHPDHYPGLADRYWENQGDGTFVDATERAGLADNQGKGLGVLAWDLDGDQDVDLYVANDSTENRLWINNGRGRFTDQTLLSGAGVNANGLTEAGMGIAVGDVNGGGPDLLVTNFDDESNTLYSNEQGLFRDVTLRSGLEAPSRLPVGFGTVLADFDHDTHLDLVVANGHIIHNIELYHDGKSHAQALQLFRGHGDATFEAVPAKLAGEAFGERYVGRGLYSGDLDDDGDLDLILTQCGGPAVLLENLVPAGRGFILRGLEAGSEVQVNLVDQGALSTRVRAGRWPSYFGACALDVQAVHGEAELAEVEILDPRLDPRLKSGSSCQGGQPVHWFELSPDASRYIETKP